MSVCLIRCNENCENFVYTLSLLIPFASTCRGGWIISFFLQSSVFYLLQEILLFVPGTGKY